jgi:acetoacetyl-CoA synthetase
MQSSDVHASNLDNAQPEAPLWQPSQARIAQSNLLRFMKYVGQPAASYDELWQWSVTQASDFWQSVWHFCELKYQQPWMSVLNDGHKMPGARWFSGAKLNFAENLLKHSKSESYALVAHDEQGNRRTLTYKELYLEVAQLASAFRQQGVEAGDRVVGFMPNVPETVVAMLAAASIGAIWSSCSPDFGIQGVMDRFGQIAPKVLIVTDGYFYGGKTLDSLAKVSDICERLPSLEHLVVVPYVQPKSAKNLQETVGDLAAQTENIAVSFWQDFMDVNAHRVEFAALPFDHPLYIMYSSGTTGVPKCMVHSAGGTLLQHAKELVLHTDLTAEDTLFYYTTCGWMMWNWLVSGLMTGATLVLFDGSPFAPDSEVLWRMAEQEKVTVFGISAKYISALEKAGVKPAEKFNLENLKAILSTGSPLAHESFDYVYREIKTDVCLSSISGGTDIISCFALGNPMLPVVRGELQCRGLGMDVAIYSPEGHSLATGKGELVCQTPFPSMPTAFWNDDSGKKFHNAYFASFQNIWAHGDYGELIPHDNTGAHGMVIHGRSDAVLNPGGVRIGTAEIYRQVEQIEEVVESIAVGQDWKDDVRVVLFVVLKPSIKLSQELIQRICNQIRSNTTPRHVPAKVIQVSDIPRTISGKIVELAVRNVIHGRPVTNTDALKNPEALEFYRDLEDLKL